MFITSNEKFADHNFKYVLLIKNQKKNQTLFIVNNFKVSILQL